MLYETANCINKKFPVDAKYFKEDIFENTFVLPEDKTDISKIINVYVCPEIKKVRLINNRKGCSVEGQRLSGAKISVQLKMKQKVRYMSVEENKNIHVADFVKINIVDIGVPMEVNGVSIQNIYDNNSISIVPYIEKIKFHTIDERSFYTCVLLFLNVAT